MTIADALPEVRRRVLRQLIESLVYEGTIQPRVESGSGGVERVRLLGRDDGGNPVVYCWTAQRRFSFDRVRLGPEPVLRSVSDQAATEATSPRLLLDEIGSAWQLSPDPERLLGFATELEHTIVNDTQARRHWREEGRPAAGAEFDELESQVVDGHPYHPSYKSRLGFDAADNAEFGPEFARLIRPVWVAVRRDLVECSAVYGEQPQVSDDRVLVPVHPWQWRTQPSLTALQADGTLVTVGTGDNDYRAQQSIRSLANVSRPEQPTLKLALSITNTSTARTLAPHTVANAPLITGWLQGIAARDPYLAEELRPVLLGEVLGVAHSPELAAIWRESIHRYLTPGEGAAPFTALTHVDAAGEPFIARWMKEQGVEPWTRRLLEVAVPPVLHFLVAHGIALEAHAQNMILVHEGGRPRRLALRDFHDGIRFSVAGLAQPADRPALRPTPPAHVEVNRNSYLEAGSDDEVRDFVHDCLFFVNLGELAMFLEDRFDLAEERFWSMARRVIEDHRRRFPELADRAARFDVLASSVSIEQLTTRRLLPETEVRLHRVRNPLSLVDAD
ncbi:MAG TPA: IucA/IucC family protein [Acidimicrobiia bacterium]|nr:IucA/IucC family protein [Acidimicrobiia bacterium]